MLILIIIIVALAAYIITKRNAFNTMRRSVQHQTSNIGVQLEKRAACLNDAMRIAKVSYSHEVEGMERLTARDQLDQLTFLAQKYPTLQFVNGYGSLIAEAQDLNRDISASRELLNGNIREYNDAITAFPAMLVASLLGYKEEKFLDEENAVANRTLRTKEVDFDNF